VTIVELAGGIRRGGQTVDLRGAGGDVAERMGLLGQMRERSLEQHGIAWIKADGSRRAEMPVTAFHGSGIVSKLEYCVALGRRAVSGNQRSCVVSLRHAHRES
jgi:hypothetical protein